MTQKKNQFLTKLVLLSGAQGLGLLALRSSVRAALTCHWHVIHYRPILVLWCPYQTNKTLHQKVKRFIWQGHKDSNPEQRFWRPTCYHYTIPLCCAGNRDIITYVSGNVNYFFCFEKVSF